LLIEGATRRGLGSKCWRAACTLVYARAGVDHAWLVNPLQRTLEALRLSAETPERWLSLGAFRDEALVRAEPFEAIELDLGVLWRDVQL
jgi:Uma2 family endonuclease